MNHIVSSALPVASPPRAVTEVSATLNFIRRQGNKPVFHSSALTGGKPKYLYESEAHTVTISDMREFAEDLSVDREGFELLHHRTAVEDLYDDDAVEQTYYPEIEALLRRKFGASQVVIFDVTRRSDGGAGAEIPEGSRGPASRLHVDYTTKSGPQRVKDFLGEEEAARLTAAGARIIQINVWRPIHGPVERSPLALADASSTHQEDLIATDQIFPDRVGEIYNVAHAPTQRWYYAPQMTPDEVLLIKGLDSLDDGRARFTPHSAFNTPEMLETVPARESIEVRTLVVIE
ncbi:MAG: CmcJ/NvfI family oxidoreductase [Alphaproteobacteria bacterium]